MQYAVVAWILLNCKYINAEYINIKICIKTSVETHRIASSQVKT